MSVRTKDHQAAGMHLRVELEQMVVAEELRLVYEPIVDLGDERVAGVEALVRWEHPERGLLRPAAFIAAAETSGKIEEIGRWVLHEACYAAAQQPSLSMMSVNVSARQLEGASIVGDVVAALRRSGLAAQRLVLELTETADIQDPLGAIDTLNRLKEMGVCLALDDFGTGCSTLAHLRLFPVDFIKIDLSFVQVISSNRRDQLLVGAIIDLAHTLGVQTIAEGIERPEQRSMLGRLGCDLGQGYLWPVHSTRLQSDSPQLPLPRVGQQAQRHHDQGPTSPNPTPRHPIFGV